MTKPNAHWRLFTIKLLSLLLCFASLDSGALSVDFVELRHLALQLSGSQDEFENDVLKNYCNWKLDILTNLKILLER